MSDEKNRIPPEAAPNAAAGSKDLASGLAADRTTLLVGGGGAGKTIFALQSLVSAATQGAAGVFVSFEEEAGQLSRLGESFGWDIPGLEKERRLMIHARVRPKLSDAGQLEMPALLQGLRRSAEEIGARRIAFDGLPTMLALVGNTERHMDDLFLLRDWLFQHGFTAFLTANLHPDPAHGAGSCPYLEFVSDCVVSLEHRLEGSQAQRFLRVVKYRGAALPEMQFPFVFGPRGIEIQVGRAGPTTGAPPSHSELETARQALKARIQALDAFLEMKQAELDFLIEKQSREDKPVGPSAPGSQPRLSF